MTDVHLRPRTISELVDAAFALYRRNAPQYIVVTALGNAPLLILQLILPRASPASPEATLAWAAGLLLVQLAWLVTYAMMSAVVVRFGSDVYLGKEPGVAATVRDVVGRVPALLLASLYKGLLILLGFFAFGVGALYVLARYFAVSTTIVLERKGPYTALGRSSALSRGRKWNIFGTLMLAWIIYFLLAFGITAFAQLAGSTVVQLVVTSLFTIVAYPVIALTELMLYYDARIRGEGFDLEQMAASLDAAPGAVPGTTVA